MKLPRRADDLARFARDTIDECLVSRESRRALYRDFTNIYYAGSEDGSTATRNIAFEHVDKMSSYLYSPADVRFTLDGDDIEEAAWKHKAGRAARYLNRRFRRAKVNQAFAEANEWALVKGCTIMRVNWSSNGFEPWVIHPDFFGVLREDIEDLDRQDAFCVSSYLTETALRRLLSGHAEREQITGLVSAAFDAASASTIEAQGPAVSFGTGFPNLPINIPGITTPSPAQTGKVDFLGFQPGPMLAPEVASRLVRIDELWVWDDSREDYVTIQYVDPGILLEGKYQRRNLTGVKEQHPFRRVCSNPVPNYFWGRSDIPNIFKIQRKQNARIEDVDRMYRMQANPARTFRGFNGMTDEKARALLSPGGYLIDGAPAQTTAVTTEAQQIPPGYLEYIRQIGEWAEQAGGFTAILSGQGEPGVRAGNHANTLLRTSTPRLRDRALLVEQQIADVGDLCWNILCAKVATVFKTEHPGEDFMLKQMPDDTSVMVDSHSSSPAFSGEAEQKLFELFKVGAIGPEDLIRGVHVPNEDELIANLREREQAHSKVMEELHQQDPEQWAKAVSGGRKR